MGSSVFATVFAAKRCTLAGCIASCILLAAASAPALASTTSIGSLGAGAGQFESVDGLAVDQESGALYVADPGNDRVDEFSSTSGAFAKAWGWGVADGSHELQSCTTTCFKGIGGAGVGAFSGVAAIAVDNDVLSLEHGYVYVISGRRVQVFDAEGKFIAMFGGGVNKNTASANLCLAAEATECQEGKSGTGNGEFKEAQAIAVGPNGNVYVGDENRVQKFSPVGVYEQTLTLTSGGKTTQMAVGSGEDVYEVSSKVKGIREYEFPTSTLLRTYDSGATSEPDFTLGEAGAVFVAERSGAGDGLVKKYEAVGAETASFPDPGEREECAAAAAEGLSESQCKLANGIAFAESPANTLYVSKDLTIRVGGLPGAGPVVVASAGEAGVPASSAMLKAEVIPEGHETNYHFEYGLASGSYESSTVAGAPLMAGFAVDAVSAAVTGLRPATTYHFRVVATDSEGHTTDGPDETLTTDAAATVSGLAATEVTEAASTLQARVDPLGESTTYRFVVALENGEEVDKTAPVDLGAGTSAVSVSARLGGLRPGTGYRYRIVAENALGSAEAAATFQTQEAAGQSALLDSRVWERVTPADKGSAYLEGIGAGVGGEVLYGNYDAASSGQALAFPVRGVLESTQPSDLEGGEAMARRQASGGWSTRYVGVPAAEGPFSPGETQLSGSVNYQMFTPDLSQAIFQPLLEIDHPPLLLSPYASEPTVYLRSEALCGGSQPVQEGCFEPLVTAKEGYANVPAGTKFGPEGSELYPLTFETANPDLSHVLLRSNVALTAGAPPAGLYEWAGGKLQLVEAASGVVADASVDVDSLGEATIRHTEDNVTEAAISSDGTRVVAAMGASGLDMRDTARGVTVRLDSVQAGAVGVQSESKPLLEAASADLSRIFFVDDVPLTPGASATPAVTLLKASDDLYVCEVVEEAAGPRCDLRDLTAPVNTGERAGAQPSEVLGVSGSGAIAYFVATGVLSTQPNSAGEVAKAGAHNVYMARRDEDGSWTTTFIAQMSPPHTNEGFSVWGGADVSPNGRYLAFTSSLPAAGFSTSDAASGEPDYEVYLYDSQTDRLTCASCNPDGARPDGTYVKVTTKSEVPLVDAGLRYNETWLASLLASPEAIGRSELMYRARSVSNEGRLFFDSHDSLVPQDTNGTWDVYEYEPPGTGSCTTGSALYAQRLSGCLGLASSGTSSEESAFVEASEGGDDAFFLTSASLVPEDRDSAYDIYDAHVCTASAPCPAAAAPVAPCATIDSCRPSGESQSPTPSVPSSVTFSGAGNAPPPNEPQKPGTPTRAQKLKRALRTCRHEHRIGARRTACERQARARYGVAGARSSRARRVGAGKGKRG